MRLPLRLFICLPLFLSSVFADEIGPFTGPEADAEAARLYSRANDYVNNVTEGRYSYSYVQFHWKLAGSNISRILRAFASSPTARDITAGRLRIGEYEPEYFRERVLPRLEEKKVASFDAVNCAIFLYTEQADDVPDRKLLLEQIILTLCRQIRWGEALGYPVLDEERAWLWNLVTRQAVIYRNDKLADELLSNAHDENKTMLLHTKAEALGFRGESMAALDAFLTENGQHEKSLRLAILRGLVRRQKHLDRAIMLNRPIQGLYDGVDGVQLPSDELHDADQWTNLQTFYATFGQFPVEAAQTEMARYMAFLGRFDEASRLAPEAKWTIDAIDWLVDQEQYADAITLGSRHPESTTDLVLLLARAGRLTEADQVAERAGAGEMLLYARTRGQLLSTTHTFMVREHTFSELAISNPNLIGRLICEWSLTPNRALRGAAPWDAIVYRFAPGFTNLPEPQDQDKVEAAGR